MTAAHLVDRIRWQLRAAAEPERAAGMQRYMKSAMPYLGVRMPAVRAVVRDLTKAEPPALQVIHDAAATLWREAGHREERYAATALTGLPAARAELSLLPLHTEMIVTGAWWDHVDGVSGRIGDTLAVHPTAVRPLVISWTTDADLWLRRTSIICQLGAKGSTDLELLSSAIDANLDDREFFIRKAIGWALRQYARTDPDWVWRFVTDRAERISPLSRREALKHL
ncbi:DNA alkylation repair protein [Angustibacter sp. McL0619]|uniref:DNA alkylation repair protein n=1 Tax=Angustibacter sp. McL0619 TaxID=3415676 RepID=UPI003CF8B46A